jgi:hypothetical protein
MTHAHVLLVEYNIQNVRYINIYILYKYIVIVHACNIEGIITVSLHKVIYYGVGILGD